MYIEKLKADVVNQKEAVDSGNKKEIEEALEKGAKDTKDGASHAKPNPKLYELAKDIAPAKMEETEKAIEQGKASGADVTDLMGELAKQINADTDRASDM